MEQVGKAITAVKDILGKDISEDFVRDHLKEIQKLASGDIKVLDDLQKAATKDFIVNLKTD
jgi:ribosome recycling factor